MDIKKTVVISVFLHICFFGAALLLFEGSAKLPDTDVVFISLAASEPKAVKTAAVPAEARSVEKAKEPVVEPDVALDKAEEISEEVTPEEPVIMEQVADENTGDLNDSAEEAEVAQVVEDHAVSSDLAFASVGQGIGILPRTIELISIAIERVKTYPIIARKRGIEGTVHVSFNIMADGNPYGIKILKSSGFRILDKATVKVVKKAAPFPLVASRIVLPVAYRLRN